MPTFSAESFSNRVPGSKLCRQVLSMVSHKISVARIVLSASVLRDHCKMKPRFSKSNVLHSKQR